MATEIITAISTLGFPVIACCGMAWYVKYITDKNEQSRKEESENHKAEVVKMTEALNNNTLAINTLTERLHILKEEETEYENE